MERLNAWKGRVLEDWERQFAPAHITLVDLDTGEQTQELSLVAAKIETVEQDGKNLHTGEKIRACHTVIKGYVAAGREAKNYEHVPGMAVFSPFRSGQIASYDAAEFLFTTFLKKLCPKFQLIKPVVCIRIQEQTTQVEARAMVDAGMMAGARKVFLYQEPLAALLHSASEIKELRHGYVFHIERLDDDR